MLPPWLWDVIAVIAFIVGVIILYFLVKLLSWLFAWLLKLAVAFIIMAVIIVLVGLKLSNLEWFGAFVTVFVIFVVLSLLSR